MDEYEAKFRELSHFTVDLDMTNEIRKYRMHENGLRDEIKMAVSVGLFSGYSRCVESARTVERTVPKLKVKETKVMEKTKTNEVIEEKKNEKGKHQGQISKENISFWKKSKKNGEQEQQGKQFKGYCYKCIDRSHRAADYINPEFKGEANVNC